MEKLFAVIGALVLIPAFVLMTLGIGFLSVMWQAWWLHPLWAPVLGPLGVPVIGYWHFVGLRMFLGGVFPRYPAREPKKEYSTTQSEYWTAHFFVLVAWPPVTYYFVRWVLPS